MHESWSGPSSTPSAICPRTERAAMNIGSLLPRHARYRPDHLAFVFGGERLS